MPKVERTGGIALNGNTYFVEPGGQITKAHGEGVKVVQNPETIAAVKAAAGSHVPEVTEEAPARDRGPR